MHPGLGRGSGGAGCDCAATEFVKDGKLFVITKSAVWANELTFYKSDMISRLNKRVGRKALTEIVFKPGRVKRRQSRAETPGTPDLEGIELTKAELERVESAVSAAGDSGESLRQLMITSLRVEKWERSQGWKPCRTCGALQNTGMDLCPPCRFENRSPE